MTKVLSILITAILCTVYASIIIIFISNNYLSPILLVIGLFIIIYGINQLEHKISNKNH